MSKEYDLYIEEHRANVKRGLEWMQQNLPPSVIDHDKMVEAVLNAEIHDESKYSKEEYDAYDDYFYGGERTFEVIQAFNLAWLHHQHENPHHWQYWVLVEDGDETDGKAVTLSPQEMPIEYIYEMIADWWTFSWRANNLLEIFNWYNEHRPKMVLHSKTRYFVEQILNEMYKILKMQVTLRNPEIDIVKFEIPEGMIGGFIE